MTSLLIFAALGQAFVGFLLAATAIFMILLILVQRGRGGGLAGALGGMGGSSAFGAKAGDVFTRITGWSALFWIVLCMVAAKTGGSRESRVNIEETGGSRSPAMTAPAEDGEDEGANVENTPPAGDQQASAPTDGDEQPADEPSAE